MSEFEDRVRQWLLKWVKNSTTGKVLTKGLMAKLRSGVINDPVAIRKALMLLREDGHIQFTPDERGEPVSSYVTVIKPAEEVPQHVQNWSFVLKGKCPAYTDIEALMPVADSVSDLSQNDMERLLDGLLRLRHDQGGLHGQPAYLVSARYLLGSSKLLGDLPSRSLKSFGIDRRKFSAHPFYVVVAGCSSPEAVILVENPAAFEMAISTHAITRCAFIATFGFGLSKSKEDYGNQLAGMVENHFAHAITLRRDGASCPDAAELLSHRNVMFWGDLDPAGIEIYLRLKKTIPGLRLSAAYRPMIESLTDPARSHPYVQSVGKELQPSMPKSAMKDDPVAATLLELCVSRGVDQEQVSPSDIESFAHHVLAMDA